MPIERPNTVSGLEAKRAELLKFRKGLEQELRKVTCDLDHLEGAIALFDPDKAPLALKRYATQHRAKKGAVRRFVLAYLRTATEPVTSRQITEAWIAERGLNADDATFVLIRKRTGACLTALREDGIVYAFGLVGDYKGWRLSDSATHATV